MEQELERRIMRLEDLEEIRRLIIRYAEAADRQNDAALMSELFAEQAVWESSGFGAFKGRAAIVDGLSAVARTRVSRTLHYMIAPLIDVANDRSTARASWRIWEIATLHESEGRAQRVLAGGKYESEVVRITGQWRFGRVRLEIHSVVRCEESVEQILSEDL